MVLRELVDNLKSGARVSDQDFRDLGHTLVHSFAAFVGDDAEHDEEPCVEGNTFTIWCWSKKRPTLSLATSWSCVIGGGLVDDDYIIDAHLFLFHIASEMRLRTIAGDYLLYVYDAKSSSWSARFWEKDEWGEWDGVVYPAESQRLDNDQSIQG